MIYAYLCHVYVGFHRSKMGSDNMPNATVEFHGI